MIKLTKRDIKKFFSSRNRTFKGDFLFLRTKRITTNNSRFAFIVSSAVKRNAPARNLTRRRITEIIRSLLLKIKPGYDIIFSYKLQNKKAPSFAELKRDIEKLLKLSDTIST